MKWISQAAAEGYLQFQLVDSNETVCSIKYQQSGGSVRVLYDNQKRNFLLRKKGLIRSRTLLENEYGVTLASISPERNELNTGIIQLPDHHYHYSFSDHAGQEIRFYETNNIKPFATCGLAPGISADEKASQLLLLVFSWYLGLQEANTFPATGVRVHSIHQ